MISENQMTERIEAEAQVVAEYLAALKAKFHDVPDSQLFDAAVKMAGDRRLEDALLAIDGIVLEASTNLLAVVEELI